MMTDPLQSAALCTSVPRDITDDSQFHLSITLSWPTDVAGRQHISCLDFNSYTKRLSLIVPEGGGSRAVDFDR